MALFRDNDLFKNWDSGLPDEVDTNASLQPVQPTGTLNRGSGGIPMVNTGGVTGTAKQFAVDFFSGLKEASGYNKARRGEGSFLDPIKGAGSMLYKWVTGTARVGAEISLDVFRNPTKEAQAVEVKNPILKALLGTDVIVPIGQQVEAMGERYGENLLTAGLFAINKSVEAQGLIIPKGTGAFEVVINKGLKPLVKNTIGRMFREDVSPVIKYLGGSDKYKMLQKSGLPGEKVDILSQKLELWSRQLILEEKTHGSMKVTDPGYMDALMKIPDEQVLENLTRLPGTATENLIQADKYFKTTELSQKLLKNDVLTAVEKAKNEALAAIDDEARLVLKDPQFKATLESLPEKQRAAFSTKLVEANKKSLLERVAGEQKHTSQTGFKPADIASGPATEADTIATLNDVSNLLGVKKTDITNIASVREGAWELMYKKLNGKVPDSAARLDFRALSDSNQLGAIEGAIADWKAGAVRRPVSVFAKPTTAQELAVDATKGPAAVTIGSKPPPTEAFKPIAAKVMGEAEVKSAFQWATKHITSEEATINLFFERFPNYLKFAPRFFKESIGPDGFVNVSKFLEEVKNAQVNSQIVFKAGTASEKLASQMKANGYYPMNAPETVKGTVPLGERFKQTSGYLAEYGPKEVINPLNPSQLQGAMTAFPLRVGEMGVAGKALTKVGLSPKPVPYGQISEAMKERFGSWLGKRYGVTEITSKDGVKMDSGMIYQELRDLSYQKSLHGGGVGGSLRTIDSLTTKDIQTGLGVDEVVANGIRESIRQSKNISTEYVGALPKLLNALRASPGFGPIMSKMVDATYYGHFEISPFHATRYAFKTTLLASLEGAPAQLGRLTNVARKVLPDLSKIEMPNLFGGPGARLPNLKSLVGERLSDRSHMIIEDFILRDARKGFDKLNDTDLAVSDYFRVTGEGVKARSHNVFLRLANYNEREEAGLIVEAFGRRRGMTGTQEQVIEAVAKDGTLLADAKQVVDGIVGYRDGYLTSPLAKTLNIAFYPSRFDAKVTMLTSEWLVKQNPLIQKTLFVGMQNMVNWSQTPEGKEWVRQNDKYMKLLNNIQPYATIGETIGAVAKGEFADAGLMGGLPFGFVQSILTETGLAKNTYMNPETGREGQQTIPRGVNRDALILGTVGLIRHFFPMPIYTFSLQRFQSPYHWFEDNLLKGFGVTEGRNPYGPNPYFRARPDNVISDDTPEPWKTFLRGFLGENEEEK